MAGSRILGPLSVEKLMANVANGRMPSPTPGTLPPAQPWGSPGEGQIFAKPPVQKVNHQRSATPKRKPADFELVYKAEVTDTLGLTAKKTSTPIGGSKNLAQNGIDFLLHGNNRIGVLRKGKESTSLKGISDESIYRVFRVWSAPLDPANRNNRTADYSTGGHGNFTNDGTGGHLWVDVPGVTTSPDRSGRSYRRHLMEFLVGIEGKPDAGGIYFIIVLDETPDEYRVSMHKEIHFQAKEWIGFFPLGFSLTTVKTDSGPEDRPTVAVMPNKPLQTEDDLPVILDYGGWHKFPEP